MDGDYKVVEISPRPYFNSDWCVDYTLADATEHTAHFDDPQAAQDWINLNRMSLRDALEKSLADEQ